MVELVAINTNDHRRKKYTIQFLYEKKVVTKELLKSDNMPDIASIPISSQDYINESKNLTQEKLRISCFQKCYDLCNRNSNPSTTNCLTYTPIDV